MTMAQNYTYTLSEKSQSIIKTINPHNVAGQYNWIISSLYALKEGADAEIIHTLNVDVERFSSSVSPEDLSTLQAEYANVVRFCYDKAKAGELKIYNDGLPLEIPSDVVEFCKKAIDPKAQDQTFIPFAGRCEFALAFDGKCSGFEISRRALAFDRILLEAFGSDMELEQIDVLCPDSDSSKQYDHIVSVPPFMKGKDEKSIVAYFLSLLEANLKEGGDMCVILPLSATYSITWQPFREYLVKNSHSFLTVVISLPALFSPGTSIKCCMFLIEKKDNPDGNLVVFEADGVDFQYAKAPNPLGVSLKTETILETLSILDDRFVKVVIPDESNRQYPLVPSRFFVEKELPVLKRGEHFARLCDLVSKVQVESYRSDKIYDRNLMGTELYIRFSSLSDNYMSCKIDISKIPLAPARYMTHITEEAGYYASFLNGVIRVGFLPQRTETEEEYWKRALRGDYDPVSYWIGIDGGVFHFRIKVDGEALPGYILRELMSDYVTAQAKRLACLETKTGLALYESDFFNLLIVVPSLEEQERILEQDKIDAIKKAGVDLDELNEKFRKDVHMMKHGLGQTVFNLGNWMKMLNYARKAGNGIVDDKAEIGGLVKVKVADIYDNIEAALKVLNRQITTFDMGDSMEKTEFSLTDFIVKYIDEHPRPHVRYEFPLQQHKTYVNVPIKGIDGIENIDLDKLEINEYQGEEYVALECDDMDLAVFSKEALTIIFENIVSNAVAHGFTDPDKEYVIHFDFKAEGSNYILFISNNGAPLPAFKDPSEVFIWGKTNGGKEHAGIGGYQIKDLMEHFDGKAEIISTPDEEFTVTYKLTFTKTNLMDISF